jgi:hypothetical protein
VIVWYQVNADLKQVEAQDQATARRYAKELPRIWTKLTKEFGAPLSDGNEPCYHGPDGRYDVYVDSAVVEIESRFARRVLALTISYPANGTGTSCSHRPSWIAIRNNLSDWALAHEFMHALQFSHRTAAYDGPIAWWTEGGATWAGDLLYPDDNTEQRDWPDVVMSPLAQQLARTAYDVQTSGVTWSVSGTQGAGTDSIRAGVDPGTAAQYDVTDCHGSAGKEPIVLPYLDIGHAGPFMSDAPQGEIVKSADPRSLEGHRAQADPTQVFMIDDTWGFKGSE